MKSNKTETCLFVLILIISSFFNLPQLQLYITKYCLKGFPQTSSKTTALFEHSIIIVVLRNTSILREIVFSSIFLFAYYQYLSITLNSNLSHNIHHLSLSFQISLVNPIKGSRISSYYYEFFSIMIFPKCT